MSTPTSKGSQRFASLPYVWAAIGIALVGGFGLGALLLLGLALGLPVQSWWAAGVQAHGYAQLVGWGGLMVLGVGLHVLPRLRGAPLARPTWQRWALILLVAGLLLRIVGQPGAAMLPPDNPARLLLVWLGLAASGLLVLSGATLVLGILVATHLAGPPTSARPAFRQVQPLLVCAFGALLLGLAVNAGLCLSAAWAYQVVLPSAGDLIVVDLLLLGFLVPVSVAVSARFFPLYLGLRQAPARGLALMLGLLLAGVTGRMLALPLPSLRPLADGLVGLGLLAALWSLFQYQAAPPGTAQTRPARSSAWLPTGLVRRQPPPPGRVRTPVAAAQPAKWLARSAYGWLLVAAVLDLAASVSGQFPPLDAERHALGAGFITLLILGMGTLLLPGFLGGTAPAWPVVLSFWLGNLAALLRVAPVLLNWLAPAVLPAWVRLLLTGLAGLLGILLMGLFAIIVAQAQRGQHGRTV